MTLADILKSDANALKLFSPKQISALEASLIPDADNKIQATYQFQQNLDQTFDKVSAGLSEQQRPSYLLNTLGYGVVMC
ncbi:MAG: hypothetical protein Q8K83_00190 [Methylotenera sp.]|nr:hypothetical protein [Methylotenera sp.]